MSQEDSQDSVIIIDAEEEVQVVPDIELPPLSGDLQKYFADWKKNHRKGRNRDFLDHIFLSQVFCDVKFVVKGEDGKSSEEICGHQDVLKGKSEFFTILFSDRWGNDKVDLTSTSINSQDFRSFLRFLYVKEITVTSTNVMSLYNMAHTYDLEELTTKCQEFLEENLNEEDVLTLFPVIYLYDERKQSRLLSKLVELICNKGETLMENPEMLSLTDEQLAYLFSCGERRVATDYAFLTVPALLGLERTPSPGISSFSFQASTPSIIRFFFKWVIKNFGRQKLKQFLQLDDLMDRLRLKSRRGDEGIPNFRGMLRFDELAFKEGNDILRLPPSDPQKVYEIHRFNQRSSKEWIYRPRRCDRVSFRCSSAIMLVGIGLFGEMGFKSRMSGKRMCPEDEDVKPLKYDVDIFIHHHGHSHKKLLSVYKRAGDNMDLRTNIYKVDIPPVFIQSDELYTICVRIAGPPSYVGKAYSSTKIGRWGNTAVRFEFVEASPNDEEAKLSNATGVPIGQIPMLYFKLVDEDDDELEVIE